VSPIEPTFIQQVHKLHHPLVHCVLFCAISWPEDAWVVGVNLKGGERGGYVCLLFRFVP
ncbi:hypothetical protein AZE42_02587, partial [Rhizopogon vesiculosus]